ncbi:AAA family ATPase (plasmid) [Chromobacterium amazonense]|uniref:AAA family ATPase n=1 Tax=Chromobacterium amazonense TaxID=1382803 RepID=UPI00237D933E|nr:AAA family ATPase [Chromobacterium amazonense]MDE1712015.1 AAA family ATPase [Chromobacterium amazonense]
MIESIVVDSVASYRDGEKVTINPQRINLVYGYNGSGKSTIANFLQNPSGDQFKGCGFTNKNPNSEILVYNTRFVEKNFLEGRQPGVFTLSGDNAEAEQNIAAAENLIQSITSQESKLIEEGENIKNEKNKLYSEVKDNVWKAKFEFEKTELDFCLVGFKSEKEKFYQKVSSAKEVESPIDINDLKKIAGELNNQNGIEKEKPGKLTLAPVDTEKNCIFQEPIIGSSSSYLQELINKVGCMDWVDSGRNYLDHTDESCPFCQQKLPLNFKEELSSLFDQTYEAKKSDIQSALLRYEAWADGILVQLNGDAYRDSYFLDDKEFLINKTNLLHALEENKRLIKNKHASPSEVIGLIDTDSIIDSINGAIDSASKEVDLYNDRIKNKKFELEKVRADFWSYVRQKYTAAIGGFQKHNNDAEKVLGQKREQIVNLRKIRREQQEIISENRKKVTNIDLSIQKINEGIVWIGLKGFKIEKYDEDSSFYKIVREGESSDVYKSLSEGEKTLITFLYFLETCKGAASQDSPVSLVNRIIVIDDPISSLSHNYVYEIASLIQHRVIEGGFEQVFILTHSLFFYHELINQIAYKEKDIDKHYAFFRVTKGEYSMVEKMEKGAIKNDYQSYWQAIKDAQSGKGSSTILPNMMRNILEHYFSFIHKKDNLRSTLIKLGEEDVEFKPLYRFINRESHSDAVNISDFGKIDPARFIEKFKKVFDSTGHEDHYQHMMHQ